jgi:iron complex transport system permease protein
VTSRPASRPGARVAAALVFAALAGATALFLGFARLSPAEVVSALFGSGDPTSVEIVRTLRLPQVALGLAVGAALATSGAVLQSVLLNPLADPYLIGVGPGALLGATLGTALGVTGTSVAGVGAIGACAFAGAAGAAALVLTVAGRAGRADPARLVLAGVAVGSFVAAVSSALLSRSDVLWQHASRWLFGTLEWADDAPRLVVVAVVTVVVGAIAWWRARDLDALTLGRDAARLVGVDVPRALPALVGIACVLAAAAVAAAGLVGFVGLVVPHVARRLCGPSHRALLPGAAFLGAGLLALADGVARVTSLPVGVVTALLGAPAFVAIVRRSSA